MHEVKKRSSTAARLLIDITFTLNTVYTRVRLSNIEVFTNRGTIVAPVPVNCMLYTARFHSSRAAPLCNHISPIHSTDFINNPQATVAVAYTHFCFSYRRLTRFATRVSHVVAIWMRMTSGQQTPAYRHSTLFDIRWLRTRFGNCRSAARCLYTNLKSKHCQRSVTPTTTETPVSHPPARHDLLPTGRQHPPQLPQHAAARQ